MATRRCMICDGHITASKWVCDDCEKQHGLDRPFTEWPAWAKALQADYHAERRLEAKERRHRSRPWWDESDRVAEAPGLPSSRGLDAAWDELGSMMEPDLIADNLSYD